MPDDISFEWCVVRVISIFQFLVFYGVVVVQTSELVHLGIEETLDLVIRDSGEKDKTLQSLYSL